ncbi:uncharacterized protein [Prorops nasuta]|uniref:uncharacterized protein n=1 Tax=Prorops nasuta TaxID=863751 RepID=UPI0034CD8978
MQSQWTKERYRQEQEAFVSNHGGTTSQEVIYAILPNISSILLAATTTGLIGKYVHRNLKLLLEFLLTVVPCILCCTLLSDHVITISFTMLLISLINLIFMYNYGKHIFNNNIHRLSKRRPFITNFRAMINISTAVCILAVDFQIFPRKFVKTEAFGYSLMDTGVGLYIIANALVCPEAKNFNVSPKSGFLNNFTRNIKDSTKNCIPLLIFGFGRMVAVELAGYQKHVSEYGVHWNFFLTLACVKCFTSMISSTISSKYSLISGIWIISMHEYILMTNGLREWVLSNEPRKDFFSANREGILSIPGYIGLYLLGVAVGRLIHSTYRNSDAQTNLQFKIFSYSFDAAYNNSMVLCIKLSLIAAQTCATTLFCDSYFGVSRRLANAGYCAWILTLGSMLLTLLLLIEIILDIFLYNSHISEKLKSKVTNKGKFGIKEKAICSTSMTLEIFEAVNYNGLLFFLICNVMTGLINTVVHTLHVDKMGALEILIAYMAVDLVLILILFRRKVQFKL